MTNESVTSVRPHAESPLRTNRLLVVGCFLLLGTSYMFNAMDRQVFPALLASIRPQYGLSLAQGGFVSTAFTITVALFAALSGWFMARFDRRHVLLGGLVAYSLFTLLTPLATGFTSLATLRALTGAGEALQIGAVFAAMGAFFGANRGAAMGTLQSFFGFGAFIGPVLGTRLEAWFGSWTISFYAYGIAGIVIAIVVAAVLPREFTDAREPESSHQSLTEAHGTIWSRNLLLGAASFGLVGITFFSYTALYASYTHGALGFSLVDSGAALGMYGIGAMCGALGGWVSDRTGNWSTLLALLLLAASSYILFHGFEAYWLHLVFSFAFGLMVSGFLFARLMCVVQGSSHPSHIGYAGAAALAAFYLPGPFAGYVFGALVEALGWSTASLLMVVAPALVAFTLMSFCDYSKVRRK